jgi:hypothetical protein
LYLDRYHLGDHLFLQALGHALSRLARARRPAMVVHGPGEFVERALEAEGFFVDPEDLAGMNDAAVRQRSLTGLRELNHRLVSIFTEALAPAVGIQSAERRLFLSEGGDLLLGRTDWMATQVAMPSFPVVQTTAASDDGPRVADPVRCILALLRDEDHDFQSVIFSQTGLPGIMDGSLVRERVHTDDPSIHVSIKGHDLLELLALAETPILLSNAARLGSGRDPEGTLLVTGP